MKMLSLVIIILGVVAMVLAVAGRVLGLHIATVTTPGYLRAAETLYLLAVAVMCYDRFYCEKPKA